jgi:hypothetical protein
LVGEFEGVKEVVVDAGRLVTEFCHSLESPEKELVAPDAQVLDDIVNDAPRHVARMATERDEPIRQATSTNFSRNAAGMGRPVSRSASRWALAASWKRKIASPRSRPCP